MVVRAVELDIKTGVQGETQAQLPGQIADGGEFIGAFVQLAVKIGQPWVGEIGGQLTSHAVDLDRSVLKIEKNITQISQADAEMGAILPAPAIVGGQIGHAHHFHREAQANGRQPEAARLTWPVTLSISVEGPRVAPPLGRF